MKLPSAATLILMLAATCARLNAHAQDKPLQLDARTQARLQLRIAPLTAAHSSDQVSAFATVVDPTPLLTLLSDLATAQSAYTASQAEAARSQALARDASLSAKASEAATAQARSDQARVRLLKQRLGLEWGAYFTTLSDNGLRQLGSDLAAARCALVRVDTPAGQGLKGAKTVSLDLGALGFADARVLGVARTADARLQSPGLMTLVSGENAAYLSIGLSLKASLYSGGGTSGLLIPNAALLRQGGHVYAFIKTNAQTFDRRIVTPTRVTPEGLIVTSGFTSGEKVVVQGASALLTAATSVPADEE
ncbi:hypothetical protein [Asticcacaulis taihuensis]|uniref:Multidrug efflux pump subunit AcrA (Membrane-fusion protein) n=1 Tax=Asticcacaulis taihuensis TaxID=260084 RepID=A0A1G4RTY3_9CAUL|nr:hypothetical protein [Asticcacaulis taihuensis]SCW60246.1 hypothetical protein SAMN02927928_2126 [Asticcacaulis taihuensis]